MSFPPGTEMFQFPGFALCGLCIQPIVPLNDPPITSATEVANELEGRKGGFPHSEISGSKGARTSPELIAACHVLHRLPAPRHPSEALMRLIVLSKTHARGRNRQAERPDRSRPHMRFVCQTMMSS
jgi:hypothetical protein